MPRGPRTREQPPLILTAPRLHDAWLDPLFEATIEAVEEAVLNALLAAGPMTGRDGNTAHAIPHDRLVASLG